MWRCIWYMGGQKLAIYPYEDDNVKYLLRHYNTSYSNNNNYYTYVARMLINGYNIRQSLIVGRHRGVVVTYSRLFPSYASRALSGPVSSFLQFRYLFSTFPHLYFEMLPSCFSLIIDEFFHDPLHASLCLSFFFGFSFFCSW